jgi:putative nucleotidyltransferase with HDIG domain
MTLRRKTLLIISVTIAGLMLVLYTISSNILLGSFAELEEQSTHRNVERVLDAISSDRATLNSKTGDWANWDDTYAFIEDTNPDFIKTNPTDNTFAELEINLMLFVHASGRIVFAKAFDLENGKETPVPHSLEHVSANDLLLQHPDTESTLTGMVLLPEGPMLIASRPILTSDGQGPIRGTLIFGRYLDATEIGRLADITHLSLTVYRFDDPQMPPDFQAARGWAITEGSPVRSEGGRPMLVRPLSEQTVAGYTLLRDIYGQPGLVLRVDISRAIYEQGQASLRYLLASLLAVSLMFGAVTLLLLEKLVLSRLARLSTGVSRIGAGGDLSARVALAGRDELSSLAGVINGMLEAMERSHTDIAELKRAEEDVRRRAVHLEALNAIIAAAAAAPDLRDLLEIALDRTRWALGVETGAIWVGDQRVIRGLPPEIGPVSFQMAQAAGLDIPGPIVVEDWQQVAVGSRTPADESSPPASDSGRLSALGPHIAHLNIRAFLTIPILAEGRRIGGLSLAAPTPRPWSAEEIALAEAVGRQLGAAAEQLHLYAAEQTRRQELDTLYGLSRKLVATDEMEAVLDSIACHAVESVHVTFCRILILQDGVFICRGAHPVRLLARDLGVGRPEPPPGWPHYRRVLARVDPLVLYRDDPALGAEERQSLFLDLTQSLCLVALRMGDQAFGVLALGEARSPTREPFDADKLRLTAAMADQAAGAIHRARLHEELEAAYIETVLALANATDTRDAYTGDHSARLAAWAEAIARDLGCGAEEIRTIRWAALLHDIGKIGVPDAILRKPASLDDAEWTVIHRHPAIGAAIVAPVKKLADMAPIIRAHQEHWDGTGYPDGLKGEAIPLGARILAVVDAYGAITDERVYRKARSQAEAVAELRRCAGTQFDPQVVEAFLRVLTATGDEHDTDFARIARNMVRPSV